MHESNAERVRCVTTDGILDLIKTTSLERSIAFSQPEKARYAPYRHLHLSLVYTREWVVLLDGRLGTYIRSKIPATLPFRRPFGVRLRGYTARCEPPNDASIIWGTPAKMDDACATSRILCLAECSPKIFA